MNELIMQIFILLLKQGKIDKKGLHFTSRELRKLMTDSFLEVFQEKFQANINKFAAKTAKQKPIKKQNK